LELQLEELETAATEDEIAAEQAASFAGGIIPARSRARAFAQVISGASAARAGYFAGSDACLCCRAAGRLRKLDEDVTETLESIPRQSERWRMGVRLE
jgi:transposase